MSTILPTVGRVLHFKPDPVNSPHLVYAAIVTGVLSDEVINLAVFDSFGETFSRPSTPLVQDGQLPPALPHAVWMPYQVGQAKAAGEALANEAAIASGTVTEVVVEPAPAPVLSATPKASKKAAE